MRLVHICHDCTVACSVYMVWLLISYYIDDCVFSSEILFECEWIFEIGLTNFCLQWIFLYDFENMTCDSWEFGNYC